MAVGTTTTSTAVAYVSVTTFASIATEITSALFGVSYFALTWSFMGAIFALIEKRKEKTAQEESTSRTILFTILAAFLGAAIGSSIYEGILPEVTPQVVLTSVCAATGFSIKSILTAASQRIETIIRGKDTDTTSSSLYIDKGESKPKVEEVTSTPDVKMQENTNE